MTAEGKDDTPHTETYVTDITNRYPTFRDEPFKTVHSWLDGRRYDDGAEGLWRVHDTLYDLKDFVARHPGGSEWIRLTKGTDVTEAFETHHIGDTAQQQLRAFRIRDAAQPRNIRLTFDEGGFYRTLKRRVSERLKSCDLTAKGRSKLIIDCLLVAVFASAYLTVKLNSLLVAAICGVCVCTTVIAAHNFIHQRDNWRMLLMNLAFLSYREWRVSHVLSHHLYPNSILDLEVSLFEPFLCWLPWSDLKNTFQRYGSWIYSPCIYLSIFLNDLLKRLMDSLNQRKNRFHLDDMLPLMLPTFMFAVDTTADLGNVLWLWGCIVLTGSFCFGLVGLNAGHHHPKSLHSGDHFPDRMDFGLYQMATIVERKGVEGSLFRVLTTFGDHSLHHLFPTLDHAILPQLNDVFRETCHEFGVSMRKRSWLRQYLAQNVQLARTKPKTHRRTFPLPVKR